MEFPNPRIYQLFCFSGNDVKMTTISVNGKIGNPLTALFHVESCRHWSGKVDSLNNAVIFSDENKLTFRVKKLTKRKFKLISSGYSLRYSRVSELTNVVLYLDRFCSCSF